MRTPSVPQLWDRGGVGGILLARLIDRGPSFRILTWTYLSAAKCTLVIGEAGASIRLLVVIIFAAGFCVGGGHTASNALATEFYPTAMRSTGVGWALGIGRIGSIVGPTLGGTLLARGGQIRQIFWLGGRPVPIATAGAFSAVFLHDRQRRGSRDTLLLVV